MASGGAVVAASSIPAIAVFEAGTAIFRTMGNAKVTMKISLIMNIINCIGNSIFIYGLSMGTRGAAISTVIARWFSAVVIIVLLLDNRRELCFCGLRRLSCRLLCVLPGM